IWDFKAIYDPAQIVDANLVAWYKFDGDATDSSGYGRDLTVMDGPVAYVEGVEDQAVQLDGVDDWAIYEFPTAQWPAYTVTAWAKLSDLNVANYTSVFTSHGPTNTSGFQIDANTASDTYRFNNVGAEDGTFGPLAAEWVHLAVAYDGLRATLFYNGSYVETVYTTEGTFNQFAVSITRNRGGSRFDGLIDDVRVYDRELTDPEILKIMRGDLARAWNPKPGDGAIGVETEPTLTWTPGDYVLGGGYVHYVYFGPDDPCNLALVGGTQPQNLSSHSPGLLDLDRTYYWVVDEVNAVASGGVDPGKIWKFTTADYIVIDDMEGYQPANAAGPAMYEIWVDGMGDCLGSGNGTGANIFTDSNGIGGSQAMWVDYDHDGIVLNPCVDPPVEASRSLYYSKVSATIANLPSGIGANWNAGGARALSLQFYGKVGNATTESLWVQLSDAGGPRTKVFYGTWAEEEDLEDVNEASWHEWFIDLADFGVDLNNVLGIAIGIGNEVSGPHTASGTLHIDDIRLYVPRCLPLRAKGPADFDSSCVVDFGDLMIMTDDWALSSYDFTVAAPSDANLDAHYQFEDNLLDNTANVHHANPVGMVSYAAGKLGTYALALDGTNAAVATGYKGVLGTQDRTSSAWIKTIGADVDTMMIVNWGSNTANGHRWAMRVNLPDEAGAAGGFRADIDGSNIVGTTDLRDNEWHHVAAVLQSDGSPRIKDIAIYVDGFRETLTNRTGRDIDIDTYSENDVTIGKAYWNENFPFTGLIDDLRIYSRALAHEEVAGLAELTVGATLTQPLRPLLSSPEDTNLFPDDAINFKDYVNLLNVWLDEVLWPQ
ncbi:MAG: LamG domain-containing protein, partial [Phycisphaerae bacterium]|nr:LamG domain-containing protein [Phycisphaerae bacterium]